MYSMVTLLVTTGAVSVLNSSLEIGMLLSILATSQLNQEISEPKLPNHSKGLDILYPNSRYTSSTGGDISWSGISYLTLVPPHCSSRHSNPDFLGRLQSMLVL